MFLTTIKFKAAKCPFIIAVSQTGIDSTSTLIGAPSLPFSKEQRHKIMKAKVKTLFCSLLQKHFFFDLDLLKVFIFASFLIYKGKSGLGVLCT